MPTRRALLGSVELVEGNTRSAIAIVHAFVENQGDAWTVTCGLSRPLRRRAAPAGGKRPSRRKRGAGALSALHVADRPARRRDASRARRKLRNLPISRPNRSGPRMSSSWIDEMPPRGSNVSSTTLQQRRDATSEADRPLVDQVLAQLAQRCDHRPPEGAASAGHRRPDHPSSRRLPSRPDADRQGRYLYHRFRGRPASSA